MSSASAEFELFVADHAEVLTDDSIDALDEGGMLPDRLWLRAMDITGRLRSALDWIAYATAREYSTLKPGQQTPYFPRPGNSKVSLTEARARIDGRFPGLATRFAALRDFYAGIVEDPSDSYRWLEVLNEVTNEMKHRMPLRIAVASSIRERTLRKSGWAYTEAKFWLSAETENMKIPNVVDVLGSAGCGVLRVLRNVGRITKIRVRVPDDGPFRWWRRQSE